jgi:hypothetical protein
MHPVTLIINQYHCFSLALVLVAIGVQDRVLLVLTVCVEMSFVREAY